MGKVTMKMIADKAGVSTGTVDRALNNRGRILPETKENIIKIAKALGYQPNRTASMLRKNCHFKIAVIMSYLPHYFTDELLHGLKAAQQELQDYLEIDFLFSNSLAAKEQLPILQSLRVSDYDAIAINAGSQALSEKIDSFINAGLPVATFNSDIPNSRRLFYVGEKPYKNGRIAGELMSMMLGGKGTVAVFSGFSLVASHAARAAGFKDYLKEHCPDMKILDILEYHDREDEAYNAMRQIAERSSETRGVFCVSAVGAIGVGRYLKEHFPPNQICLIGYDISHQSAQLLQEHYCSALIYQEPRKQGYQAIHLLFDMLSAGIMPKQKEYFTKVGIIISENMQDYIDFPLLQIEGR